MMVECRLEGLSQRTATRISDLSLTGCFIEAITPMPVGRQITVYINVGGDEVALNGRVARVQEEKGRGFALDFENLSQPAKDAITSLLGPHAETS
jgi:hypothetical protein